jgi:hypothetical protein
MTKETSTSVQNEIKELLAESRFRIKIYDYIKEKSDELLANTSEELFSMNIPWDNNEFALRLKRYEDLSAELLSIMSLVGYWGTVDHLPAVSIPPKLFAVHFGKDTRSNIWTSLRWYPLMLITYALGIGAVEANNYSILHQFLQSSSVKLALVALRVPPLVALEESFGSTRDSFKVLPNHEKHRYPFSEYLFLFFKDKSQDLIFLGDDYEEIFDRLELIYSLQYAHDREKIYSGHVWGPMGRFGWKYSNGGDSNPFKILLKDASSKRELWAPTMAGFFGGSYERFEKLAKQYEQILQSIH